MKQSKKDIIYMEMAKNVASFSNCVVHHVGCIIVKDGRIISMGYNGSPPGCDNCNDVFHQRIEFGTPPATVELANAHHAFSEKFEVHAEQNAILHAAKNGIAINGAEMYCTLQPCNTCLKMICQTGITRIVYDRPYNRSDYDANTTRMLQICQLTVEHLTT